MAIGVVAQSTKKVYALFPHLRVHKALAIRFIWRGLFSSMNSPFHMPDDTVRIKAGICQAVLAATECCTFTLPLSGTQSDSLLVAGGPRAARHLAEEALN